jgi:hypothetical protein
LPVSPLLRPKSDWQKRPDDSTLVYAYILYEGTQNCYQTILDRYFYNATIVQVKSRIKYLKKLADVKTNTKYNPLSPTDIVNLLLLTNTTHIFLKRPGMNTKEQACLHKCEERKRKRQQKNMNIVYEGVYAETTRLTKPQRKRLIRDVGTDLNMGSHSEPALDVLLGKRPKKLKLLHPKHQKGIVC